MLSISKENLEFRDDMMKYFIQRMSLQSNAPSLNNSLISNMSYDPQPPMMKSEITDEFTFIIKKMSNS